MTCKGCAAFAGNPFSGLYIGGCQDCAVRHLAQSLEFYEAKTQGRIHPAYQARLRAVFGDAWEAGHMRVKAFVLGKEKVKA